MKIVQMYVGIPVEKSEDLMGKQVFLEGNKPSNNGIYLIIFLLIVIFVGYLMRN